MAFFAFVRIVALGAMALALPGLVAAQPRVELRADFNTGPNAGSAGSLDRASVAVAFDGRYLFTMRTAEHGNELWETDGTALNTRRLTDLCPGACDGLAFDPQLRVLGTRLLFSASDGRYGFEPWSLASGSSTPTMLADVNPGAADSNPGEFRRLTFSVNGSPVTREFFTALRTDVGRELWRLHGGGAQLEMDLLPGEGSSTPLSPQLCSTSQVCVSAIEASGARVLKLLNYGSTSAPPASASGVPNLDFGPARSLREFAALGPTTYVVLKDTGLNRTELHVFGSDPTASMLLDSIGGSALGDLTLNASLFRMFYVSGGELKVTNGTLAGTQVLAGSAPQSLISLGNRLVFTGVLSGQGRELHVSDGTVAGTGLLRELVPGSQGMDTGEPMMMLGGTGARVFVGFEDPSLGGRARIWVTDGTLAGTVDATGSAVNEPGFIRLLASLGTTALFAYGPRSFGSGEPWFTQGTPVSTVQLGNFASRVGDSNASVFGDFRGHAFVQAFDGSPHRSFQLNMANDDVPSVSSEVQFAIGQRLDRLWYIDFDNALAVGDGTVSGAQTLDVQLVTDAIDCYVERAGLIYFPVTTDGNSLGDIEIARSDGTTAGTVVLTDLSLPGVRRVDPFCFADRRQLAAVGDRLLFVGANSATGMELFALDASDSAALVRDIRTGISSSQPRQLLTLHGRPGLPDVVLFHADDGVLGIEPWTSDGTGQGTLPLADINPGQASSSPRDFILAGDRVFFTAVSAAQGRELYVSDGTIQGTRLVTDLFAGAGSAFGASAQQRPLLYDRGHLYFSATSSAEPGCALFQTDGTAAGTRCAYDSQRHALGAVGGEAVVVESGALVFAAHRSAPVDDGRELRVLLGGQLLEVAGSDLMPGPGSSNPAGLRAIGTQVLFGARGADVGQELFRLDATAIDQLFSDGFEP